MHKQVFDPLHITDSLYFQMGGLSDSKDCLPDLLAGKMFPTRGDLYVAPFTDDALYMEHYGKSSFW